MCGIVGAVSGRNVAPILVEGLRRLEYRGYDSAGAALMNGSGAIHRMRALGKVQSLADKIDQANLGGTLGIAHTRWATHGEPSEHNAHPHMSGEDIALVHNGIIENHAELRAELIAKGYEFTSATDTEVIAHQFDDCLKSEGGDPLKALHCTLSRLEGAYALAIMVRSNEDELFVARSGSPLVIGLGEHENFIASDVSALISETRRVIFLDEGDMAHITRETVTVYDMTGAEVSRPIMESALDADAVDKGEYAHFMLKEIHEQPLSIKRTLEGRLAKDHVLATAFGARAMEIFPTVKEVHIVACGTSFHAGKIAQYWLERFAGIPTKVDIASEYRYRQPRLRGRTLFVSISQSGETADTLACLRLAKELGYLSTLAICNVAESSLVRESDHVILTHAGKEIGVASTKAFTTQLSALLMLTAVLSRAAEADEATIVGQLHELEGVIDRALALEPRIAALAKHFADKRHALFLGRGSAYPVAQEGALKLKEISYIHAEAYAAGELKHGPLALIDADMPVVVVAPNNELLDKLKSNMEEVRARGGQLYVFADEKAGFADEEGVTVIPVPHVGYFAEPIIYSIPLQLLAYHVALIKGTDVDQPRNLAKSVTVE